MRYFLILVFLMSCVLGGVGRADEGVDRCQSLTSLVSQLNNQMDSAFAHGVKAEPYAVKLYETPAAERMISLEDSDELFNETLNMENDIDAASKTIMALDALIPAGNTPLLQALHLSVGIVLARDGKFIPFYKYRLALPLMDALTCEMDEQTLPLCQAKVLIPVYATTTQDGIRKAPFQDFKTGVSKDIFGMVSNLQKAICAPTNP